MLRRTAAGTVRLASCCCCCCCCAHVAVWSCAALLTTGHQHAAHPGRTRRERGFAGSGGVNHCEQFSCCQVTRMQVLMPLLDMFSQSEALVSSATSLVVSCTFLVFPLRQAQSDDKRRVLWRHGMHYDPFTSFSVQNARLRGKYFAGAVARQALLGYLRVHFIVIIFTSGKQQMLVEEDSRLAAASVVGIGRTLPPPPPPPLSPTSTASCPRICTYSELQGNRRPTTGEPRSASSRLIQTQPAGAPIRGGWTWFDVSF